MLNNRFSILIVGLLMLMFSACAQQHHQPVATLTNLPSLITDPDQYNELSDFEAYVILKKGTERAFSGQYHNSKKEGTYICRQCNNPLFRSADKFDSGTGWPSYDDMIAGNVKELPDRDGRRTEIVCANCDGHLGHVFKGEGFTSKQTRHCVNSASLNFVEEKAEEAVPVKKPKAEVHPVAEYIKRHNLENYGIATFAGGCFWCTEAVFQRINGVVDVISGYSGGERSYPTYRQVASGATEHAEAIMIFYDKDVITYKTLLDVFFRGAHDPTQLNRQGPDKGKQYRSEVFYQNEEEKALVEQAILKINEDGVYSKPIVTLVTAYEEFWVAEGYHQDFYELNPTQGYIVSVAKPKVKKAKKLFGDLLKAEYK